MIKNLCNERNSSSKHILTVITRNNFRMKGCQNIKQKKKRKTEQRGSKETYQKQKKAKSQGQIIKKCNKNTYKEL